MITRSVRRTDLTYFANVTIVEAPVRVPRADLDLADAICMSVNECETESVSQTCVSCTALELVTKTTNVTGSSRRCFMFRMFHIPPQANARGPPLDLPTQGLSKGRKHETSMPLDQANAGHNLKVTS